LPDVLEADVHPRFYLSPRAAAGILRRAEKRGKEAHKHIWVRESYGQTPWCQVCGKVKVISQAEVVNNIESDRQAARDGYNPNW
jgi:hypothetical protein